jgi:hypothetical protein
VPPLIGASTTRWLCLISFSGSQASLRTAIPRRPSLERVPIKWNQLIDKDAAQNKKMEHVLIEKSNNFSEHALDVVC